MTETKNQDPLVVAFQEQMIQGFKEHGYILEFGTNQNNSPTLKAYRLKTKGRSAGWPVYLFNYRFATESRREEFVVAELKKLNENKEYKESRKAAKKEARENMVNPYTVGEVVYDSWGYEQTNIDFYEIVEVKEKSVMVQRIGSTMCPGGQGSGMSSNVKPDPTHRMGEPELKILQTMINSDGKATYFIKSRHGWISKYDDGEKGVYSSWYA